MANIEISYRHALPEAFVNGMFPDTFAQTGAERGGVAVALVDEDYATDIGTELATRGWASIGAGDQRPAVTTFTQTYSTTTTTITAHPAWTAPDIATQAAGYSGGLLVLLDAARLSDLQDLAGRCATLEDEVIALRGTVDQCLKINNAIVDLLQAHGIAG